MGHARRERLHRRMAGLSAALGRGCPKHLGQSCAGGNGHPGADPRPSEHFPFPADPSTTTARALAAQITMRSKKVDLLEKV